MDSRGVMRRSISLFPPFRHPSRTWRPARLRDEILGVGGEGHAEELGGIRLGPTERLPLLRRHQVEDRADGAFVALLGHREISLGASRA